MNEHYKRHGDDIAPQKPPTKEEVRKAKEKLEKILKKLANR